jgi:phage baseplate assembly protein W
MSVSWAWRTSSSPKRVMAPGAAVVVMLVRWERRCGLRQVRGWEVQEEVVQGSSPVLRGVAA